MKLGSSLTTPAQPTFREPLRYGRLFIAIIVVLSLLLGYRLTGLVFDASQTATTQQLLDVGVKRPSVHTDNGEATAENAQAAVEAYLGFLAEGDASSATAMAGPTATGEAARFLTDEVFAQAVEHISDAKVILVKDRSGGNFEVQFTYTLAGSTQRAVVQLHRKVSRWVFEPMVTTLNIKPDWSGGTSNFSVSGIDANLEDIWASYWVYPAVYQIDQPTGDLFVGDSVKTIAWVNGDYGSRYNPYEEETEYRFDLSAHAKALVDEAVLGFFNSCLTQEQLFSANTADWGVRSCGQNQLREYSNVSDLEVEVVRAPVVDSYQSWPSFSVDSGLINLSFNATSNRSGTDAIEHVADLQVYVQPYDATVRLVDGKVVFD